jgi:uncharacterized membrane protein
MTLFITIINTLLLFWLVTLIWNEKVAKRVFQIAAYIVLAVGLMVGIYLLYEGLRWGQLIHQLNTQSQTTTQLLLNPSHIGK